ncbi:MAG: hypothetical protein DRJ03_16505 [Chloroflexi bacterium]|nr:MAG: hypothetical protein DRJ03_16505 [Chloroflexota bacterium]
MQVLDIGAGKVIIPIECDKLVRLDANKENGPDIVHDIMNPLPKKLIGEFDMVYMSHVLEHIPRPHVLTALRNVVEAVKPGGEMWIIVPSLEWMVSSYDRFRPTTSMFHLSMFGGQQNEFDYHYSAFSLYDLRYIMEGIGLAVRDAYQTPFQIQYGDKVGEGKQNISIGVRLPVE